MPSPATLDFDRLLAPISAEQPAGIALRADDAGNKLYYEVKGARDGSRDAERLAAQAEATDKPAAPDWPRVRDLATDILSTRSKDLWISAWLIEAQARLAEFAGIRDGFRLARELAERYWDGVHPRPDEDGLATTVAQLSGLNGDEVDGTLLLPLRAIAVAFDADGQPLSGADYHYAYEADGTINKDRRAALIRRFEGAARTTPPEFARLRREDVAECQREFDLLTKVLDEKCGVGPDGRPLAPQSSRIRGALASTMGCLESLYGRAEAAPGTAPGAAPASASGQPPAPTGRLASRDDALRMLLDVAEFFRRNEPHSPISYALEQVVRWGHMSLPALLSELIRNDDSRNDIFRLTGIPKPKKDD